MPKRNPKPNFTEQIKLVVKQIPGGQTLSYGEVARMAGYPRAARAVASVMSKNYDPSIPCHRVIRQNGGVGQYNRGGEAVKTALLLAEGWTPK